MANFDLSHTGQDVDDAITAVKNSGANAAAWLAALGYLDVTPGTAELSKAVVLDASKQIDELDVTTVLKSNSNYVVEGYTTGRVVLRAIKLKIQPGATPNTNINITDLTAAASRGFNGPTITDATDLAAAGSSGSFSLDAGGTEITLDITEAVVGVIGHTISIHDINTSSTTETYHLDAIFSSGNLLLYIRRTGSITALSWLGIMDTGDRCDLVLSFVTST